MKIGKLFLAGVVALGLGLTACNNDTPEVQKGTAGTLTVNIMQAGAPATKLAGNLTNPGDQPAGLDGEKAIKKVEVWVFAGGNLEQYKTGTDNPMKLDGLSAGTKAVAVVVNGNIGSKATLADLKLATNTLSQSLTGDNDPGMVMSWLNESVALVKCPTPTSDCNEVTAEVERVNARVALVGVKTTFDAAAPFKTFELEEVAMFNVRETSLIFGNPLITTSKFLYGSRYPSKDGSYVGYPAYGALPEYAGSLAHGVEASLLENSNLPLDVTTTPLTIANSKYFYVYENDETPKQGTILVLKGKLKKEDESVYILDGVSTDAAGNTYYAIWVNAKMEGYSYNSGHTPDGKILRNNQYNIDVTLTRAGSPTIDPTETACLSVTVNVKKWTVVNQTVVW
jgi:hypothetical protein